MKMKNKSIFCVITLVIPLLFSACPDPNGTDTSEYTVTKAAVANGNIQVEPNHGPAGTEAKVWANPEPGYRLTELKANGETIDITQVQPWVITLYEDKELTAKFTALPGNEYSVSIASLQHGSITANPPYGPQGTTITLTVTPDAGGYGLKDGSLVYSVGGGAAVPITGNTFILPEAHVTVTAVFETKTSAQLITVGTQALAQGNISAAITAFESAYQQDNNNKEAIVYSSLGALASIASSQNVRSLMMNRLGFAEYPGTIDRLISGDWFKTYVGETITYWYYDGTYYYSWYDPQDEWDAKFFARYGLTPQAGYYRYESVEEPTYVFASSTRKTGPILSYIDETTGDWVYWSDYDPSGDNRGPGYYYYDWSAGYTYIFVSGTQINGPLDSYYDDDLGTEVYWSDSDPSGGNHGAGYYWGVYEKYTLGSTSPQYETWTEKMPGLSEPGWFTASGMYKDNLTSAGALQATQWPLLFFANLVDKNQNGLNDLLDDILSSVFGAAFTNAESRFAKLAYTDFVEVDEELIAAFGLTDVLEGDKIYIGKAELDILFSAVRLFKASLEWIAAYDWNTDLSFLKTDWAELEGNIGALSPKSLPFANNFMTDRKNGMMNNSKNDFDKALTGVIGAYTHLSGANSELPPAYVDVLQDYIWLQDGLSKLQSAIKNGGTFYVSEPSGNTYNNSAANAIIGINMGKLFTPGQFAIDKLISTESGGKAPQFYVFNGETPTAVTNKEQLNNLGESYLGFRIKFGPIKEVVVKGLDDMLSEDTMDMPLFPAKIGKDLYGLYHK